MNNDTEKNMNLLNLLFSLGVLADFSALVIGVKEGFSGGDLLSILLNGGSSVIIGIVLIYLLYSRLAPIFKFLLKFLEQINETVCNVIFYEGR